MKPNKNWLEWTVFAFSIALTLGVLGFLARDAATSRKPARLDLTLGNARKDFAGWRVPVRVDNTGDETAAAVVIEVTRANSEELGELAFDFVPRGSYREGWVLFSAEPGNPQARVRGYQAP